MLRNSLKDGNELIVRYNLAVVVPHRDLVCVSTLHGANVVALWVSVIAVASKGWCAIRAEQPIHSRH